MTPDERKNESFEESARRIGPGVARQVHESQLRADSSQAAREAEERTHEVAHEIELRDELQIAEEMQGRVLDEYFYEFEHRSTTITGLSVAGVKAIARNLAGSGEPLSVVDLKVNDDEDHYTTLAKVENLRTHEVRWGVAIQSKTMKTKRGDVPDEFALTKAANKAQRNALRQFIPEIVIVQMYREWKAGKARTATGNK